MGRGGGGGGEEAEGGVNKKTVCVTGANGYVAAELVKQLLARGGYKMYIHIHSRDVCAWMEIWVGDGCVTHMTIEL